MFLSLDRLGVKSLFSNSSADKTRLQFPHLKLKITTLQYTHVVQRKILTNFHKILGIFLPNSELYVMNTYNSNYKHSNIGFFPKQLYFNMWPADDGEITEV